MESVAAKFETALFCVTTVFLRPGPRKTEQFFFGERSDMRFTSQERSIEWTVWF